MATECRRTKSKRINRNKLMKVYAYGILLLLVVIGGVMGDRNRDSDSGSTCLRSRQAPGTWGSVLL